MNQMDYLQKLCAIARMYFNTEQVIIGGGAPRDVLSGKEVKDIDVFVRIGEDDLVAPFTDALFGQPVAESLSPFHRRCNDLAVYVQGTATFRPAEEGYGADICDIATDGCPVQVIGVYVDPVDDVHNYDFGLSQVFVTPNGYFETPLAQKDRANGTITYTGDKDRSEDAILRSVARLERLRAKYIGWTFENCKSLDERTK